MPGLKQRLEQQKLAKALSGSPLEQAKLLDEEQARRNFIDLEDRRSPPGQPVANLPPDLALLEKARIEKSSWGDVSVETDELASIERIRDGVDRKQTVAYLARLTGMDYDIWEKALQLTSENQGTKLNSADTEKALAAMGVAGMALELFPDEEAIKHWFMNPSYGLRNHTPLELLDSIAGINLVMDYLAAMRQGNYW